MKIEKITELKNEQVKLELVLSDEEVELILSATITKAIKDYIVLYGQEIKD